MKVSRRCRFCDKPFTADVYPSTARYGVYCSQPCFFAHRDGSAVDRFWARIRKTEGCWLWTGYLNPRNGYGALSYQGKAMSAHRFSYALHHGSIPAGLFICHHCDTPACVRPDHLYAGTIKDNTRDAIERGQFRQRPRRFGSAVSTARLTETDVLKIRMLAPRTTYEALARQFNVDPTNISAIVRRKTWRHV